MAEIDLGQVILDGGTSNVACFMVTASGELDLQMNFSCDHSRSYNQGKIICPLSAGTSSFPSQFALENIYPTLCENAVIH